MQLEEGFPDPPSDTLRLSLSPCNYGYYGLFISAWQGRLPLPKTSEAAHNEEQSRQKFSLPEGRSKDYNI